MIYIEVEERGMPTHNYRRTAVPLSKDEAIYLGLAGTAASTIDPFLFTLVASGVAVTVTINYILRYFEGKQSYNNPTMWHEPNRKG